MPHGEDEKPTSSSGDDYAGPTLVQKNLPHDLKATQRSADPESIPKIIDSAPVETTAIIHPVVNAAATRDSRPRQSPGPMLGRTASSDPISSDQPYQVAYSSPPDGAEPAPTPPMNAVRISPALMQMYAEEVDEAGATMHATFSRGKLPNSTLKSVQATPRGSPQPVAEVTLDPRKLLPWLLLSAVLGGAFASAIFLLVYLLVLRGH